MRLGLQMLRLALAASCGISAPAIAQSFVNLDFDEGHVVQAPPPFDILLDWSVALPGWGHGNGDATQFIYYNFGHVGTAQVYVLLDASNSPFGADSGTFSVGMRNGRTDQNDPSTFTDAFLSQTGLVPPGTRTLTLLATNQDFSVQLNGVPIRMQNIGLDPANHASRYLWSGDVSSFAGQVVELRVVDTSPDQGGGLTGETVTIDEIRLLPVPEPAAALLLALGMPAIGLVARSRRKALSASGVPSGRAPAATAFSA